MRKVEGQEYTINGQSQNLTGRASWVCEALRHQGRIDHMRVFRGERWILINQEVELRLLRDHAVITLLPSVS
jgi:hypothetical protein